MAEEQWGSLFSRRLRPYELFFSALKESLILEADKNIDDWLADEIKNRLLPDALNKYLYSFSEQLAIEFGDKIMKSEARSDIIEPVMDEIQNEIEKIVADVLSMGLKIDAKMDDIDQLSLQTKTLFSELSNKLGNSMSLTSEMIQRIASIYKTNLSILDALNSLYGVDSPCHLYPNYIVGLDDMIIKNGRDNSIYYYFCYSNYEDLKMEISDATLKVLEALGSIDEEAESEICETLNSDIAKGQDFDSTCNAIASRCASLSGNKECMNALSKQLLPVIVRPLRSQEPNRLTIRELKSVFNKMFREGALLEVEVFRRIVNLGYSAIPRAKVYERSKNGIGLVGECDTLISGNKDGSFTVVEVTRRKDLSEKSQKVNDLSKKLGEGGVKVNILFVCEDRKDTLPERSVTFKELDNLGLVLYGLKNRESGD